MCLALLASAVPARAQEEREGPVFLGTVGPPLGDVVLSAGGGIVFLVPYGRASARIGLGLGTSLEATYELIGVLGHAGEVRLGWGMPVAEHIDLGAAVTTGIGTLRLANDIAGIAFTNFDLGNDWTLATDVLLSVRRPGRAHITVSAGPTFTLADLRFTSFSEASYVGDFGFRAINVAIQGEWALAERRHLFIRLEGLTPFHAGITPIGFLPTASAGLAWAF